MITVGTKEETGTKATRKRLLAVPKTSSVRQNVDFEKERYIKEIVSELRNREAFICREVRNIFAGKS